MEEKEDNRKMKVGRSNTITKERKRTKAEVGKDNEKARSKRKAVIKEGRNG